MATPRQREVFTAEPLRSENSWRVVSDWGAVVAYRVPRATAERIAAERNARA